MSNIPRTIRLNHAARLWLDIIEEYNFWADADAGFDGGEFSGPANGRAMERELKRLGSRLHLTAEAIDYKRASLEYDYMIRENWGDDPMGSWHGRNE